jgi:V/A-type H+-transporting ATPase subunit C
MDILRIDMLYAMVQKANNFYLSLSSKLTFRPLLYGYSNARVHAMRTFLLPRRDMENLVYLKSNEAVEEYLVKTPYKEDFNNISNEFSQEERVEIALNKNLSRTCKKLLNITPKSSRPALLAFLNRYDVHNLKTILFAKKLGKSKKETYHLLINAGSLTEEELEKIFSSNSTEELYNAIRSTQFGLGFLNSASIKNIPKSLIKKALLNASLTSAQIDFLIFALDSYYYEMLSKINLKEEKDAEFISRLLKSEIDAKNLLTIFRMKKEDIGPQEIMKNIIEGGNLSQSFLAEVAQKSIIQDALDMAKSFFTSEIGKADFQAAVEKFKKDGRLSGLEVAFENSIARKSLKVLHKSSMSIAALIGFLFLKEEEVNNLRKIVRGKSLNLSPEKILEMLVLID